MLEPDLGMLSLICRLYNSVILSSGTAMNHFLELPTLDPGFKFENNLMQRKWELKSNKKLFT